MDKIRGKDMKRDFVTYNDAVKITDIALKNIDPIFKKIGSTMEGLHNRLARAEVALLEILKHSQKEADDEHKDSR